MKKNILTIIILAAVLVNLTLSAVMLFVYLPNAQKMNNLITKICQVIELELESPLPKEEKPPVLAKDLDSYVIASDMVISLSKSANGRASYATVNASLVLNTKAEDYAVISALIPKQNARIKEIIQDELGKLTKETFQDSKETVKKRILEILQEEFTTECIYRLDFDNYLVAE